MDGQQLKRLGMMAQDLSFPSYLSTRLETEPTIVYFFQISSADFAGDKRTYHPVEAMTTLLLSHIDAA